MNIFAQTEPTDEGNEEDIGHYVKVKLTINNVESVIDLQQKQIITYPKLSILAEPLIHTNKRMYELKNIQFNGEKSQKKAIKI